MENRVVFLDYLRVVACFMVICVHCIEPFYIGGDGLLIKSAGDGWICTLLDSAFRSAVPLFVMASSYLLFPLKYDTKTFFRKRFVRVAVPLAFWAVLYAVIPFYNVPSDTSVAEGLQQVAFNFTARSGHLWFVYMLLGVYLVMPMLSPWIEKLSKKGEAIFLAAWLFTTLVPFFRLLAEDVTGLDLLWGEAVWNEFGFLYYISGFVGYMVLAHYFRTYVKEMSWGKTVAIALPLWVVGFAITAGVFWCLIPKPFPAEGPFSQVVEMETSWRFCTVGVVLMTVAYFMIIRKFTASGAFYKKIILPISNVSYGMYLMHMFILMFFFAVFSSLGLSTMAVILSTAVSTFITAFVITKGLSYIPFSKYFIG